MKFDMMACESGGAGTWASPASTSMPTLEVPGGKSTRWCRGHAARQKQAKKRRRFFSGLKIRESVQQEM
jgi:hypothetical protein